MTGRKAEPSVDRFLADLARCSGGFRDDAETLAIVLHRMGWHEFRATIVARLHVLEYSPAAFKYHAAIGVYTRALDELQSFHAEGWRPRSKLARAALARGGVS